VIINLGDRCPDLQGDGHFIAPTAAVIGSVTLKQGASIWFNAVLRGDNDLIEVGVNSNIQDGAVLHTDPGIKLVVGDNVTVGHMVMLHGCTIGSNSLIGIGSTVLNGARIGKDCIVGAHALITEGKEFADGVLILGSPAKVVRDLKTQELEFLKTAAEVYVQNGKRYLKELATDPTWSAREQSSL
jgi:carbonic anhydrase/acetyltransferase-like protein (isoleucine patch superfamily)